MTEYVALCSVNDVFIYISEAQKGGVQGTFQILRRGRDEIFISWTPVLKGENTNHIEKYTVFISVSDISYVKKNQPLIGAGSMIVMAKGGVIFPPFYFMSGGLKEIIEKLKQSVTLELVSLSPETYQLHPMIAPIDTSQLTNYASMQNNYQNINPPIAMIHQTQSQISNTSSPTSSPSPQITINKNYTAISAECNNQPSAASPSSSSSQSTQPISASPLSSPQQSPSQPQVDPQDRSGFWAFDNIQKKVAKVASATASYFGQDFFNIQNSQNTTHINTVHSNNNNNNNDLLSDNVNSNNNNYKYSNISHSVDENNNYSNIINNSSSNNNNSNNNNNAEYAQSSNNYQQNNTLLNTLNNAFSLINLPPIINNNNSTTLSSNNNNMNVNMNINNYNNNDLYPSVDLSQKFSFQEETNLGSFEVLPFESDNEKWEVMMSIQKVEMSPPLTRSQFMNFFDSEGRITNFHELQNIIYHSGVEGEIRRTVWKFLLKYYPAESSLREREEIDRQKRLEYSVYTQQWKSITPEQESHHTKYRNLKDMIIKDVVRTDRILEYFKDEQSPYLNSVYNILMSYSFFNFDIGYVQGMNDLVSVLLIVMDGDECEAFGCFKCLMNNIMDNFKKNQVGIHTQVMQLIEIIRYIDPQLYQHLKKHKATSLLFCFRWLIILFKREFTLNDIQLLWDVIWSNYHCSHHQLFVCLAMLLSYKLDILHEDMGFDEILQHITVKGMKISAKNILEEADCLYQKFQVLCSPEAQNEIFNIRYVDPKNNKY